MVVAGFFQTSGTRLAHPKSHCMSDSTALESFLDKWRARWPEWAMAEVFVPEARRPLMVAWFALLQEFQDAMNVVGNPVPADAKLAWWAGELRDWSQQRSRHPLGRMLEPCRAPWAMLADALPVLAGARDQPQSAESAFAQLEPFGEAVAAVEAVVLDGPALRSDRVVVQLLSARLLEAGAAALPRGNAGGLAESTPIEQWADTLLDRWVDAAGGARERRIHSALARARLQRHGRTPGPSSAPLRTLFIAWRAARGG